MTSPADDDLGGSGAGASSVAGRIRRSMDTLAPQERRVARAILAHYPAAGLETTSSLAERAKVSPPTVVRFVTRLGYAGYRAFQAELREEIQARGASPVVLAGRGAGDFRDEGVVPTSARIFRDALVSTFSELPEAELRKATELLAAPRSHVLCLGGRFSGILADYLQLHLRQMRPNAGLLRLTEDGASSLVGLGRDHVLVVFDFRRYQDDVITYSRLAARRGAKVVLVTDPWMSPISEVADVVLPSQLESPSPFDSYVGAIAVVETLVAAVHQRLGDAATRRMLDYENAVGTLSPPRVF